MELCHRRRSPFCQQDLLSKRVLGLNLISPAWITSNRRGTYASLGCSPSRSQRGAAGIETNPTRAGKATGRANMVLTLCLYCQNGLLCGRQSTSHFWAHHSSASAYTNPTVSKRLRFHLLMCHILTLCILLFGVFWYHPTLHKLCNLPFLFWGPRQAANSPSLYPTQNFGATWKPTLTWGQVNYHLCFVTSPVHSESSKLSRRKLQYLWGAPDPFLIAFMSSCIFK